MGFPVLFPARSTRRLLRSPRRRAAPPRSTRLGWETLGYGLGGLEMLEQRALMAADLSLSFDDNIAANIDRTFYSPGAQVVYTLKVTNNGTDTATDALVRTSLASAITSKVWTAVYAGGGTGPSGGSSDLGTHTDLETDADFSTKVTLPAGASATFTIMGTIPATATGKLTSSAFVTLGEETKSFTDEDTLVPKSLAMSGNGGWSVATVRLVNPVTGAAIAGPVTPFANLRSGVRAVLVDLTGDGKSEVVCVPSRGVAGSVVVYSQNVAADGSVTLVKDATRSGLMPFGAGYNRGLSIAGGDFDGDGIEEFAVGQALGAGQVKIYRSTPAQAGSPLTLQKTFTPFAGSSGGVDLAAGDFGTFTGATPDPVRQDGKDELVVVSGLGAEPEARIYNVAAATPAVVDTLNPFEETFRRGFGVTVASLNADSIPDLVFTAGSGGGSSVEIWNGIVASTANTRMAKFAAFSGIGSGNPISAAAIDSDGDTRADTLNIVQAGVKGAAMARYTVAIGTTAGTITTTKLDTVAAISGALRDAAVAVQADPKLIRTNSGLLYKELVAGTGAAVTASTTSVKINYQGYNSDGDRFDSGTNVTFTVANLVAGFTEGLRTMKFGGTSQFIIPANLAYGDDAPSKGKPIIFIVELLPPA